MVFCLLTDIEGYGLYDLWLSNITDWYRYYYYPRIIKIIMNGIVQSPATM
jgi:hypothetical protein